MASVVDMEKPVEPPKGKTLAEVTPTLPPRIRTSLYLASLIFSSVLVAVAVAMSQGQSSAAEALRWQLVIFWGPFGILHAVRHALAHGSMHTEFFIHSPAFEAEVAGANLSFGVMSILAYSLNWPPQAGAAVVLGFCLYLGVAALVHIWKVAFILRYMSADRHSVATTAVTLLFFLGLIALGMYYSLAAL